MCTHESSLEGLLDIDESVDSIDHVLDEVSLRLAESSSVGDIEDSVVGLRVLSMDTSNLHLVLVRNVVELLLLLHQLWQVDVHRGSHCGTKVGWARGDVTEMVVVGESDIGGLEVLNSSAESVEDFDDTSVLLHGDDSELILLVNPDQEGLVVVVKDTSS